MQPFDIRCILYSNIKNVNMKLSITTLAIIILSFSGVLAQSGSEETRQLSSFVEIKVAESINAILIKGTSNEVKIKTNGIESEKVLTEIESGALHIHMERGTYSNIDVDVLITYTEELSKIRVSSSASIKSEKPIVGEELYLKASSAGEIVLPIDVQQLKVDVSSSGKAKLEGTVQTIVADASSSGSLKAYDLKCKGAKVDASSSGKIEINVSKEVIGRASSSGKVRYHGDPEKVDVETSSSGSIKKA